MDLLKTYKLNRVWKREYNRLLTELGNYTDRELMQDLRLSRSDVATLASDGADSAVDAFVRANPEYRNVRGNTGLVHG